MMPPDRGCSPSVSVGCAEEWAVHIDCFRKFWQFRQKNCVIHHIEGHDKSMARAAKQAFCRRFSQTAQTVETVKALRQLFSAMSDTLGRYEYEYDNEHKTYIDWLHGNSCPCNNVWLQHNKSNN